MRERITKLKELNSSKKMKTQIETRRNELAGNISLNDELSLINDYNKVLQVVKNYIPSESEFWRKYKPVNVRKIGLSEGGLTIGSKMNCNPAAITIVHREASALAPGGMEPQPHARVRQEAAHGHK